MLYDIIYVLYIPASVCKRDATVAYSYYFSVRRLKTTVIFKRIGFFFFLLGLRVFVIKFNDFTGHSARRVYKSYIILLCYARVQIKYYCAITLQVGTILPWTFKRERAGFWQRVIGRRTCCRTLVWCRLRNGVKSCRQSLLFSYTSPFFFFFKFRDCYTFISPPWSH